ncbi:MAG: hypothetical protein ACJ8AD_14770 [Gemmatimonadaceae bacterium]
MPEIKTLDSALRARARREWDLEVDRVLGLKSAAYQLIVNLPGYTGLIVPGGAHDGSTTFMWALQLIASAAKDRGYAAAEERAIDMHLRTVADLKGQVEALGDLERPRYDDDGEPIF